MNTENAVRTAVGFFLAILVGALLSALLGGAFGALVALVSPEFVGSLFGHDRHLVRYASAVGMTGGIFIGIAVSCFASALAAIIKILRIRFELKKEQTANHELRAMEPAKK